MKDVQGGVIPGANVTLTSESRGTVFEALSNATGDFVIPNIPGDSYTIRVAISGFKTSNAGACRSRLATVWPSAS